MGSYLGEMLLIVALVVLNGYFAAAEIALISARRASLKAVADAGSEGARVALRLTEDPSRLLAAVQVGITFVGFLASATAAVSLSQGVAGWLRSLGSPGLARVAGGLSVVLVTVAVSYLTLVLGELTPKRLGLQRANAVAVRVARPIAVLAVVAAPLTWLLTVSTDLVGRLFGLPPGAGRPGVTEEEIKLLVTEQGTLLDEEKRMIHEVFELGDTVAREVMVPRVDMVLLEDTVTLGEALGVFTRSGYSRLPVFQEDPDTIVGVALLKDLVGLAASGRLGEPITEHMRGPIFVPETKPVLALLSEMQLTRTHLVVVVDEYGGTAGLVTIEDIVEEVIGEIADEFDKERRYVTQTSDGVWAVDARLSVEEARETFGWPVPESDEYETVAGWVLMELGHIPVPGETVWMEGFEVRVEAVRRRRIARLKVSRESGA
ncbi:MAG: hemolysin family protein [Coriobacteriia bacterium]